MTTHSCTGRSRSRRPERSPGWPHLRAAEELILAYLDANPDTRSPLVVAVLSTHNIDEQTARAALWHLIDTRAVATTLDRTLRATPDQRMRFSHRLAVAS